MSPQTEERVREDLFIASLAHELKRPVAALQAACWSLRRNLEAVLTAAAGAAEVQGTLDEVIPLVCELLQTREEVPPPTGLRRESAVRDAAQGLRDSGLAAHHTEGAARVIVDGGWEARIPVILELLVAWGPEQVLPILEAAGKVRTNLDALVRSTDRLGRIVNTFRAGLEGPSRQFRRFTIRSCLEEAVAAASHQAPEGVGLEVRCPEDLEFTGDPERLQQAVANLVANALEAVPAAGGSVLVEASLGEGTLEVAVEDNGAGIPREIRDRLFTPFFTTRPEAGGTGLGLFIARRIVENHGGTLDCTSQPGRTRFEARMPAGSPPEER